MFAKKNIADEVCSKITSAMNSLETRVAGVEGQLQQTLRGGRRQQMALESILENQNRILEALERQEKTPPLEALMSLAENFALTRLKVTDTPELGILYDKLSNLMDCFGLALVSESGVEFDPVKHEACGARCELDRQDNSVLEIVRPGFLLRNKVLRCATVIVNRYDYSDAVALETGL